MTRNILFCVCIVLVEGGFFDLTDVDDPLALLWNLPPINRNLSTCKIDNSRTGVCMDTAKCLLTKGTPSGHCGIIFTCCSYEDSCVKTSDERESYFEVKNLNSAVTKCKYTIKLKNKNVCQVRLDFEHFTLAPATTTVSSTDSSSHSIFSCVNDELRITPNNYGIPVLCGNNTNQHLYVHVNQTTETSKAVHLDINLANRLSQTNNYLPKPTWKIRFIQLECPLKKNTFDISKFNDIDEIANDFNIVAPQGAIQYFTESLGEIRSFGFNTTTANKEEEMTSYPYLEHYTIAFKRPSDVCGIKFTPITLNLLRTAAESVTTCNHYLFIPEFFSEGTNEVVEGTTGICYATEENPFSSFSPGPLYINFKAMKTDIDTTNTVNNQGFRINYELLKTCPSLA